MEIQETAVETPQISLFPNRIDLLPSCADLVIAPIVFIFLQTWKSIQLARRNIWAIKRKAWGKGTAAKTYRLPRRGMKISLT